MRLQTPDPHKETLLLLQRTEYYGVQRPVLMGDRNRLRTYRNRKEKESRKKNV